METDKIYESPAIEVIEIEVEKGFATSVEVGGDGGGWEKACGAYPDFDEEY